MCQQVDSSTDFSNPASHFVKSTNHLDTKVLVTCSCSAVWSEPANATVEQINDTMKAHRLYFNKPKMTTL